MDDAGAQVISEGLSERHGRMLSATMEDLDQLVKVMTTSTRSDDQRISGWSGNRHRDASPDAEGGMIVLNPTELRPIACPDRLRTQVIGGTLSTDPAVAGFICG